MTFEETFSLGLEITAEPPITAPTSSDNDMREEMSISSEDHTEQEMIWQAREGDRAEPQPSAERRDGQDEQLCEDRAEHLLTQGEPNGQAEQLRGPGIELDQAGQVVDCQVKERDRAEQQPSEDKVEERGMSQAEQLQSQMKDQAEQYQA